MTAVQQILRDVLSRRGFEVAHSDPSTLSFWREGFLYALDADDPTFFALRVAYHLPPGMASLDDQLALAHDVGYALKGVKVFLARDARHVMFNVESYVATPNAALLDMFVVRGLRALDLAVASFVSELFVGAGGHVVLA